MTEGQAFMLACIACPVLVGIASVVIDVVRSRR